MDASRVGGGNCIASKERLRWAMFRACWPSGVRQARLDIDWQMDDARLLAKQANVSLAALYLPPPTRWELVKAYCYGWLH